MTAPYKYKSTPYKKVFSQTDWVKGELDLLGGKNLIGDFRYTPIIGPDILSGIIHNATQQSLLTFAQEKLFKPLDIKVTRTYQFTNRQEYNAFYHEKHSVGTWVADQNKNNTAGWGLTLTTRDLNKLGQLYLQQGIWDNHRLINENWINESTKIQSKSQNPVRKYGFLWWGIDENSNSFAGIGDSGNTLYVNPKNELVVAITVAFKPRVSNKIEFIQNCIEPIIV